MTPREIQEYTVLRETIRERGTLRSWLVPVGMMAWAALTLLTMALTPWPLAALVPLLVLAVVFESVFALHTAVERVGRYLQVFYEDDRSPRNWEHQAMAYGRHFPGSAPDPLFAAFFFMAALVNFVPVMLDQAIPVEYAAVGAMHLLFAGRLVIAHRQAGRQRGADLQRFQQLKQQSPNQAAL